MASHQKTKTDSKTTANSCYKVRETFQTDRGPPWAEWKPHQDLDPLMADGFRSLRRPKRRRNETERQTEKDALYYYTKDDDLMELYGIHLEQQARLQGSSDCYSTKRTYGNDPEVIASLCIHSPLLPTITDKRVPAQADELAIIAEEVGMVYRGDHSPPSETHYG